MARKSGDKGRAILKARSVFPEFNIIDYDASLAKNLTFYSENVDNAVKKAAALSYWKSKGYDTKHASKLSEKWFTTVGAVAHMLHVRNIELAKINIEFLEKKFVEFNVQRDDEQVVQKVTKEDKDKKELSAHIAEFEHSVDVIFSGGSVDGKSYLLEHNVKPAMAKQIAVHFKPLLSELKEIEFDEQLKEGYSYLSKKQLKQATEKIIALVESCELASAIVKARKPRAKKEKSPLVLAKNVKYLREYPQLKLKSVSAEKMVNANEVWLFNVKIRKLFRYVPLDGMRLSIKGTTLLNFDPTKSGGKIIRKPEVQLKDVENMTSRPLNKLYNEIRAVPSKATGRINEDCIIIKCL